MRDPKLLCLPLAAISSNDSIVLLSEIDWHVLLGASFASQVEIRLFFGNAVAMLQNSFRALDDAKG